MAGPVQRIINNMQARREARRAEWGGVCCSTGSCDVRSEQQCNRGSCGVSFDRNLSSRENVQTTKKSQKEVINSSDIKQKSSSYLKEIKYNSEIKSRTWVKQVGGSTYCLRYTTDKGVYYLGRKGHPEEIALAEKLNAKLYDERHPAKKPASGKVRTSPSSSVTTNDSINEETPSTNNNPEENSKLITEKEMTLKLNNVPHNLLESAKEQYQAYQRMGLSFEEVKVVSGTCIMKWRDKNGDVSWYSGLSEAKEASVLLINGQRPSEYFAKLETEKLMSQSEGNVELQPSENSKPEDPKEKQNLVMQDVTALEAGEKKHDYYVRQSVNNLENMSGKLSTLCEKFSSLPESVQSVLANEALKIEESGTPVEKFSLYPSSFEGAYSYSINDNGGTVYCNSNNSSVTTSTGCVQSEQYTTVLETGVKKRDYYMRQSVNNLENMSGKLSTLCEKFSSLPESVQSVLANEALKIEESGTPVEKFSLYPSSSEGAYSYSINDNGGTVYCNSNNSSVTTSTEGVQSDVNTEVYDAERERIKDYLRNQFDKLSDNYFSGLEDKIKEKILENAMEIYMQAFEEGKLISNINFIPRVAGNEGISMTVFSNSDSRYATLAVSF